jgi:signal transduction histidine kinase
MVIRNEEGNPIRNLGVVQDITERKNLEKSLVESEKLAGIGTLAAGIAHEINTPLQIITGASENLQKKLSSGVVVHPDELERRLQNINENAWRISAIVRSLLDYARSAPGDIQACSINHIVQNMLTLTEHQFKSWSNIHILTWLDENLPDVKCNPNKIIQVLVNLLNNARDAMPKGGRIHIETTFDPELSMVLLRVKDSGVGIPADHSSRIFDPFFTTKQPGEGTGLGLSISAGILRAHGGKIELENTRESGSCFKLSLPIAGPENGASAKLESAGRYR